MAIFFYDVYPENNDEQTAVQRIFSVGASLRFKPNMPRMCEVAALLISGVSEGI